MKFERTKIIYEIGDWVTALNESTGYKIGAAYQVREISPAVIYTVEDSHGCKSNGWHISNFRPATQQEIDKAVKEVKDELKVGDYVYLLDSQYGFCEGDIGTIVSIDTMSYIVNVKGRVSTSGYALNVAYLHRRVRRATPEEIAKAKEPVKFNTGDWVTCIELAEGMRRGSGWELGLTFQITKVEKYSNGDIYFGGKNTNGVYIQGIRAATAKEIQDAKEQVIKIGDHKTVIDGGVLHVGCKSFSRSQVSDLYRVMRDLHITAIRIEGTEVRIEKVTKIYDRMCS